MTNTSEYPAATPGSVWAALKETGRQMKVTFNQMKEADKRLDKKLNKLAEMIGGISNNQGLFAEEYFFNSSRSGIHGFLRGA